MAALASDWPRHFRLLLWNHWTEFNGSWQAARSHRPLPTLCFSGRLEMAALVSDWLRHFPLLLYNRWTEFHSVTLSIDQTLHQFFNPITDLDLIIEFDFLPNCETFPTFATGAACQQRTLTHQDTWSSPTLGLASVLMLRPISSELVLLPVFWVSDIPRYLFWITIFVCDPHFYDLSAFVSCWSVGSLRRIICIF